MNFRNCHLCNKELSPEPVLELKGMPKAAQYYPEKNEFADDKGITLIICQCSNCGLVQHRMRPVEYFKEVITAASLSEKSRLSRLNQMKELAQRFGLHGKKVLDIGTGKGEMLDVLEEAGFKAAGIEASPESVEIGKSSGRKMIKGYIGDADKIEGGLFDAFISLNYLEHLPEPGRIIRNIYKNLTAKGVGFVTVPNLEYLLKTKCFYEFVADHLSYFTKKTLTYAFEANGFDVLECYPINEDNDIAAIVKKKTALDISKQYNETEALIKDLQKIIAEYKSKNKKVAVWGAGHRTLALLALSKANDIEYIIDSAKFKQGKFSPITHSIIMPPEYLNEKKVDLVIVMVPGLYPGEVLKSLNNMKLGIDTAVLRDNKIKFI
ncbi:MAG: C-methyltransferase [Parcubacteria group bacterium Athens1014_10]|nr:MAG: C-methyltransferase [Parcubacteria group bacterium Athens1014_10]TSD05542.1 MAG: C-methyltransferase [Parcubacteria group bacterium Athens0714_12]